MLTLKDGAKDLPLGENSASIEVGEISNLVDVLQTVKSAVLAGELDPALEAMVKPRAKNSKKPIGAPKG